MVRKYYLKALRIIVPSSSIWAQVQSLSVAAVSSTNKWKINHSKVIFSKKDKKRTHIFQYGSENFQYCSGIFYLFEGWVSLESIHFCFKDVKVVVENPEEDREKEKEKKVLFVEIVPLDPLAIMNSDWRKIWVSVAPVRTQTERREKLCFQPEVPPVGEELHGNWLLAWYSVRKAACNVMALNSSTSEWIIRIISATNYSWSVHLELSSFKSYSCEVISFLNFSQFPAVSGFPVTLSLG